jgi:Flp pilus assembly protein CpaB
MARSNSRRSGDQGRKPAGPSVIGEIGRLVSWHRRKLAVLCAMAAATAAVVAISPPDPPAARVVVAAHQLSGGAQVTDSDVEVRHVPAATVPHQAVSDSPQIVGRTLVSPVAQGSMLTKLNVLGKSTVAHDGNVIAPVRITDSAVVKLLHVGDHVDVLAADPQSDKPATMIAKHARVVTIPSASDSGSGLGMTSQSGSTQPTLLMLEVSSHEASALANAAGTSQLSVLLG